jgi:hypothetical protein
MAFITDTTKKRRAEWLDKISIDGKKFSDVSLEFETALNNETNEYGNSVIIDHLRVCGHIPEKYPHDSTEEKLYSKYTDTVISHAFSSLGMKSRVLTERAGVADVEVEALDYTFVADAKAFRLTRTAKNQKDFKVQAMDGWRGKNDFAIVVCPIYQLPKRSSQIYEQAITRNVCVFSYSHLCVLVQIAQTLSKTQASEILKKILDGIPKLEKDKSASPYWKFVNNQITNYSNDAKKIFLSEVDAEKESVDFARKEGLNYYTNEEKRVAGLDFESVVKELIRYYNFDNKKEIIRAVKDNELFNA